MGLTGEFHSYEEQLNALKRNAFIVTRLAAGVGELDDFQKERRDTEAVDRVEKAMQKTNQKSVVA